MTRAIDLETWPRRDLYRFFRTFDSPFFNICTTLDIGSFLKRTKGSLRPFFLSALHAILRAAQDIPALRYRIVDDGVIDCEVVHVAATVLGPEDVFRFCLMEYDPDPERFAAAGTTCLDRARHAVGPLEPHADRLDVIHVSVLPWIRFTSVSNPRRFGNNDSIPKIVFGKHYEEGSRVMLPISVDIHHALADGIHVAQYLSRLQEIFSDDVIFAG